MFLLYMDCVFMWILLMGCIKDIPTMKGDNYIEWRRNLDVTFILGEVDWVVTTPCLEAPVREDDETDAA
jgi:hypothetical protein